MKYLVLIMIGFFVLGCGVESDSSEAQNSSEYNDTDSDGTDDGGSDGDGSNDDGTSDDDSNDNVTGDQLNSDFDVTDAIKDPNACIINGTFKNGLEDFSFDPEETLDDEEGIAISSFLQYDPNTDKTKVTVYYPDLDDTPSGNQIVITESKYRVGYDTKWASNSNKTIYVRTPRYLESNYYGCYRYTLSLDKASVVAQKVYRLRE